ncbi:DUF6684 family protein [Haloarchaeobius sp. DFWS5]|uniref:DUF6684 family protein n=1 Tax=Haloarchaeobius sp. DFWS5 TaxID=3446114 RepID=UPI003EB84320
MEQRKVFDKDTILDLTVNIIPLGIMLFFLVLFVPSIYGPWPWESTYSLLQVALIVVPFIGLAVLTYFSALAIEGDAVESEQAGHAGHEHESHGDESEESASHTDEDSESGDGGQVAQAE